MYTIRVNNHIDQVLYFLHFFCLGGFCFDNNSTIFYVYFGKHSYRSSFVFSVIFFPGGILSQLLLVGIHQVLYFLHFFCPGGFCPNNNSTVFYVHHFGKHSYRSGFVFLGIFFPWGILSQLVLDSMYTIRVNNHIEQVLYLLPFFVLGGFCPDINFIIFICILLW